MTALSACTGVEGPLQISGPALTTQPGSAATDVPVDTPISVIFHSDIEIDEETLTTSNVWLLREGVSPRNVTLQFDEDTNQLLIQHELLEEGITYTVALTNYITSQDGDSLGTLIRGAQAEGAAPEGEAPPATPTTLPPGSFGSLGALVQSGGQALVTSVANAAYAWQFTTTVPQVADLGGTGPTEPETPPPPPPPPPPSNQPDGAACTQGSECASRVCLSNICQVASCDDAVKNGDETDEDCGGHCDTQCAIGKLCSTNGDCLSQRCEASVCVEPEDNSVDAGGFCLRDAHCLSGNCDTTLNECLAPSCNDGIQNADESDIDCGNDSCGGCPVGKSCQSHEDCASAICFPDQQLCIEIANNSVDPGGYCLENAQCKSGVCAGDECRAASCSDGTLNGNESDVDCGPGCPKCELGDSCTANEHCDSDFCENNVCAEPHNLANGESCTLDPQCTSNFCDQGICTALREWTLPVPISSREGRPNTLQLGLIGPEAEREVYIAYRETDTSSVRGKARVIKADVAQFAPGSTTQQPAPGCSSFNISEENSYQEKKDYGFAQETLQYGDMDVRGLAAAYNSAGVASVLWLQDMDVRQERVSKEGGATIRLSEKEFSLTQLFEQKLTAQTTSRSSEKIWPPTDVGSEFETGFEVKMAMDNQGNILAAYKLRQDVGSDTVSTLWLIYFDKSANEWTHVSPISYYPVNWSIDPTAVFNFEIAMDPDSGDAVVVWRQMKGQSGKLYAIRFDRNPSQPNQHYQFLDRLDQASGWDLVYDDFEVAYDDKDDSFVAVWRQAKSGKGDQEADFRWARLDRDADSWGSAGTLLSDTRRGDGKLYAPDLAIDREGRMFLAWKQYTADQHRIRVAHYDKSWQTPVPLDVRNGSSGFTSPQLAMNPYTGEAVVAWMAFNLDNTTNEELRVKTYLTRNVRDSGWTADYEVMAHSPSLGNVTVGAGRISQQLKSDIMTVLWSDKDAEDKYEIKFSRFYLPPD